MKSRFKHKHSYRSTTFWLGFLFVFLTTAGWTFSHPYSSRACERSTSVIAHENAEIRYAYNTKGDLVTVTAPNGGVTRFDYDAFGNISAITHADGSSERFDRDPFGNIVSAHDPLGRKTDYVYDDAFRLTRIITPSFCAPLCLPKQTIV